MNQMSQLDGKTGEAIHCLMEAATLFEIYERPIGQQRYHQIVKAVRSLRQAAEQEMKRNRETVLPHMLAGQICSQADDIYLQLVAYYPHKQSWKLSHLQKRQALAALFKALIAKIKEWEQTVSPSQEESEPLSQGEAGKVCEMQRKEGEF